MVCIGVATVDATHFTSLKIIFVICYLVTAFTNSTPMHVFYMPAFWLVPLKRFADNPSSLPLRNVRTFFFFFCVCGMMLPPFLLIILIFRSCSSYFFFLFFLCACCFARCEDLIADDSKNRAKLFLSAPRQPLDQAPFLRVIDSGDAAAQQVASIVLALLIVVGDKTLTLRSALRLLQSKTHQ